MNVKKDKRKIPKTLIKSSNLFPVVGIGASAGGLDAFKKLITAIPGNSGMAFVLVQHLDPNHESLLAEILQKITSIPVLEISDDIKVEADHIYIIPSNKMLVANDGILELSPRPVKSNKDKNLPIDLFFSSLAEVHQSHAIGVVLSGTGSDGTAGLKAIKVRGGLTFAQDDVSAAFAGMPNSAAKAGVVDFILPPEKIPQKILELNKGIHPASENGKDIQQEDYSYKEILSLLRVRKGTDFTYYKQTTLRRRILRRMALNNNHRLSAYLDFLRGNTSEQDTLYQDLLIPVTSFFRDPKIFDALCENVFPTIIKGKATGEPIRVWVAACSTGEEAYSLAMCFIECLSKKSKKVQIFATDISDPAIAKARTGIYTAKDVAEVSPSRLKEFFIKKNDVYHINKELRDMCVFASHNFLKDPPFGKMDFISCRNVLIYMETYLQKQVLSTFHYALNEKGFLLLGRTESANSVRDLFALVRKSEKLFTRNNVPVKFIHQSSPKVEGKYLQNRSVTADALHTNFQKLADDIVLSKYAPAGVIVNDAMDINHFRGNTNSYLRQLPGEPTHNLIKMAREGLGFELRTLMHKARKLKTPVSKENVSIKMKGHVSFITLEAIPLLNTPEPYYLILFHPAGSTEAERSIKKNKSSKQESAKDKQKKDDKDLRIHQLEQELAQTHEDMRSITDDQEATNEGLQSDNEELLSSSEELQSLNEELETSKEELQSTNEELLVVNQEMITLNDQVKIARDYSEAIVSTTREPLLVLDQSMRIKTANRSFYEIFRTIPRETEGKLIFDIAEKQWNIPSLRDQLEKILPDNESFFDFEVNHHSKTGIRYMLLNAREMPGPAANEKLILLAIEDVTDKFTSQNKIIELQKIHSDELESRVELRTTELSFSNKLLGQKNEELVLMNNELDSFTYVSSHDLQEPLRKIQSFADIITEKESGNLTEIGRDYFKRMRLAAARMQLLIEDLLAFSRLNKAERKFENTDLAKIVRAVENDLKEVIAEKKAVMEITELCGAYIIPFQFYQLLYNLITNALKFSKPNIPPHITIGGRHISSSDQNDAHLAPGIEYCHISVKDNGIGFEQQFSKKIFEVFQRLHGKDEFPGTGIGLAIVKKIVDNHNGIIAATSASGKGTTFDIYIPVFQLPGT